MQIDCTKTHCQLKKCGRGKTREKQGKSGGKDIEKQENASSHMSVEQGGKGLKWWGVCRMRVNGRLCVCVEGRGLMQITSEAAAQMLRKLPALGALRVLSHDA